MLNETSYHGAGAIKDIATEAKGRGFKKAFVCSDPDLIKFGVTKKVIDVLEGADVYKRQASLLFINALWEYLQHVTEKECDPSFEAEAIKTAESIISWYKKGTDYNIHMEEDGLLAAGNGLWQLTWMDVRFGDILPTPRHGKPVEINAYWYNAVCIVRELLKKQS